MLLDAYRLMQAGAEALAAVERNGICIDVEYCRNKIEWLDGKLNQARRRLERTDLAEAWRRRFGHKTNYDSAQQLSAVLYADMRVKPFKAGEKDGEGSVDEESLLQVGVP